MSFGARIQARGVQLLLSGVMTRVHQDLRFTDVPKRTETLRVETGAGPVDCTVYRPPTAAPTPAPVYVNFHGGGFIVARPDQDDHICRYIAATAGCVVVNVDYSVAPQRVFPAAVTQAYDVVEWVARNGEAHGWDGSRLAVGGHSAGANLTAGVCRTARDRGTFTPRLQIIDSAPLDQVADPATKRSRIAKPLLSPQLMRIFTAAYVPDPADLADPLASPGLADDLAGLPPALVITAENDRLRDEGDAYAKALADAGVPVTHRVFEGVDHYFTHTGPVEAGKEAIDLMATTLRTALDATVPDAA
ncbi:alpha/beta hydrolase [Streptomyces caniscabiei]|uniref:Alpha/beta hydrolase n=1 Tax=Streptomyces caniscabiei TaxID=2746961 RepID=A0A927L7X3_9ACTN|nr:alpha/beta hydrolase [Streptomyces caniscabiei]MBD9726889.1 alpha/beta hydrolase [Streptomyces caniscabiei]MDX3513712.1 alpha/beta hydrolase [Streptomyces caniscabiei]MDX3722597.1 alpha/beta hydrolase [Streptomyces caniscabiei]WEO29870.1 alpha/beta hydrolase [Streptomyces caniscabiei]